MKRFVVLATHMPIFVLFVSAEVSFDGAFPLCVSLNEWIKFVSK